MCISSFHSFQHPWAVPFFCVDLISIFFVFPVLELSSGMFCFYFPLFYHLNDLSHYTFVCLSSFLFSSLLLIGMHANSCPMVSTTTAQPVPPTCIATGAVWAQCQTLPSPSSLPPPQPPPPAPLVHGHVLHQPCCQTTLPTAHWVPPWCLHHESPAGRFVHLLWVDDRHISVLLVYSLNTHSVNYLGFLYVVYLL